MTPLEALFVLVPPELGLAARRLVRDSVETGVPGAQVVVLSQLPGAPIPTTGDLTLSCSAWLADGFEFDDLDDAVASHLRDGVLWLGLVGSSHDGTGRLVMAATQMLTRYQRYLEPSSATSATVEFRRLLDAHRAMHDLGLPLVAADYDHALDTWHWALRLAPDASAALQAAALLHDIERLHSEAHRRTEHLAGDYQEFKDRHAAAGALVSRELMEQAGFSPLDVARAERLIRAHERVSDEREGRTLGDADALSFFSLNACGFARHYGPEHTALKVQWTLRRMSPAARHRLPEIRICRHVAPVLAEALSAFSADSAAGAAGDDRDLDVSGGRLS